MYIALSSISAVLDVVGITNCECEVNARRRSLHPRHSPTHDTRTLLYRHLFCFNFIVVFTFILSFVSLKDCQYQNISSVFKLFFLFKLDKLDVHEEFTSE